VFVCFFRSLISKKVRMMVVCMIGMRIRALEVIHSTSNWVRGFGAQVTVGEFELKVVKP